MRAYLGWVNSRRSFWPIAVSLLIFELAITYLIIDKVPCASCECVVELKQAIDATTHVYIHSHIHTQAPPHNTQAHSHIPTLAPPHTQLHPTLLHTRIHSPITSTAAPDPPTHAYTATYTHRPHHIHSCTQPSLPHTPHTRPPHAYTTTYPHRPHHIHSCTQPPRDTDTRHTLHTHRWLTSMFLVLW